MDFVQLADACQQGNVELIQSYLNSPLKIEECAAMLFAQLFCSDRIQYEVLKWFVQQPWFYEQPFQRDLIAKHCSWEFIVWYCQHIPSNLTDLFLSTIFMDILQANKFTNTAQCEELCKMGPIYATNSIITTIVNDPCISFRFEFFEWFMTHSISDLERWILLSYDDYCSEDLMEKLNICFSTDYVSCFETQFLQPIQKIWIKSIDLHTVSHLFRFQTLYTIAPEVIQSYFLNKALHHFQPDVAIFVLDVLKQHAHIGKVDYTKECFEILRNADQSDVLSVLNACPLDAHEKNFATVQTALKWNDYIFYNSDQKIVCERKQLPTVAISFSDLFINYGNLFAFNRKMKTCTLEEEKQLLYASELFVDKQKEMWNDNVRQTMMSTIEKKCVCFRSSELEQVNLPILLWMLQNNVTITKREVCVNFKNACKRGDLTMAQWICDSVHLKRKHIQQGFMLAAESTNRFSFFLYFRTMYPNIKIQPFHKLFTKTSFYKDQTLEQFTLLLSWLRKRVSKRTMMFHALLANNLEIVKYLHSCNVRLTNYHWKIFMATYLKTDLFSHSDQYLPGFKTIETTLQWTIEHMLRHAKLPGTFWDQVVPSVWGKIPINANWPIGANWLTMCSWNHFFSVAHTLLTTFPGIRKHLFNIESSFIQNEQPYLKQVQREWLSDFWKISNGQCNVCYQDAENLKHGACQHLYCDECLFHLRDKCPICMKRLFPL